MGNEEEHVTITSYFSSGTRTLPPGSSSSSSNFSSLSSSSNFSTISSSSTFPDHDDSTPPSPDLPSDPPVSPVPLKKSFSYNLLNAKAQSFLPRTSSTSSLNSMPGKVIPPPLVLPPQPSSPSSLNNMAGGVIPPPLVLPPRSPITLAGTTTTQKTSFVIPQPHGPPTLLHVFTTTSSLPSPTSPGPTAMFAPPLSPVGYATVALPQKPMSPAAVAALSMPPHGDLANKEPGGPKSRILDEVSRKVLHQVEYYFSDLNVATTDHLIRYMNKDPAGYVPLSVVASFKKIRTSTSNNAQLANILRNSEKLIVSDDGKRVKRANHLSESYMEELKSRIVVAENLPDDHCHQNLMRVFSAVGSVKALRTCQPSPSKGVVSSASRAANSDGSHHSNKLHAFVEYESVELAEKAVAGLTDKKNWRSGLKVRFLIRSQVKSSPPRLNNGSGGLSPTESEGDEDGEHKRGRGRDWGKGRERNQYQPPGSRGSIKGSPAKVHKSSNNDQHTTIKQSPVPRMPDGTRGFSMGRGKMIRTA